MANAHLATYLNDHLSGSVAALELLERLEGAHAGTDLALALAGLRAGIEADRQDLERLMRQQQIGASLPRQAAAWLAEKSTQVKLRLDDPSDGALRLLESLEMVALGLDGKRALWDALAAADVPPPDGRDYQQLARRGAEQRAQIERLRLAAAQTALRDAG